MLTMNNVFPISALLVGLLSTSVCAQDLAHEHFVRNAVVFFAIIGTVVAVALYRGVSS